MRWTQDDVIEAAFATLEAEGLERLSLRGVARTLGAHLNSVSWHVKTKQSLIETMADTIIGTVDVDDLPADPIQQVRTIAGRYRAALLHHRDGGRLVAGTFTGTGKTLRVANAIVAALLAAGYPESDAARLCWSLVYLTLGLTQEQQTPSDKPGDHVHELFRSGAYPALAEVGEELMVADTFDARFDYGVDRLLNLA
ncbi:TetR/AcrR family transcriptional regulator C-terminal domain-containing protein [Pseudonocardia spinosispora]|uniref:TetR/AcrR family transcriptional regulator C-terminal domain-containing protein n=1 Tax=Pseudonocardia spinosispora TaxID=103441 RepID=UPI00040C39D7|nr:TetR/AcrR family transcriptional regulator C-terminal domain-containing protein [Pseudonocardia spinosispora]